MNDHFRGVRNMIGDTPRTDAVYFKKGATMYDLANEMKLVERELNAANQRIKRLEEALDLVRPHCDSVHHSKKHQHKYNEPCPVVAFIENVKEAKL